MNARALLAAAVVASTPIAAAAQAYPYTGRDLAAACAICHGTGGVNASGIPSVAGQPKDYLVLQLRDFRDGKRPATVMQQISKGLTAEQIDAVATFWSAQKAK